MQLKKLQELKATCRQFFAVFTVLGAFALLTMRKIPIIALLTMRKIPIIALLTMRKIPIIALLTMRKIVVLLSKQQQSCRELFLVSSQDCSPKKVTKEITTTNTTKMFDKKLLYNVLLWLK